MSDLWLCREQTAERPFWLELPGVEIRTIEELCFYLYQNLEHLEEELMEEPLFLWLAEELKLPRLAASLRQEKKQGKNVFWCAWFLLKEIGMYSEEELKEHKDFCLIMDSKDEFEYQKLKADRLFTNKKYNRCIREYYRLIQMGEEKNRYPRLLGDIWHNLGAAHTRLFLFGEAAEHFKRAYALNLRPESLRAYQQAVRMAQEADLEALKQGVAGGTEQPAPSMAGSTEQPASSTAGNIEQPAPSMAGSTEQPAPSMAGSTEQPAPCVAGSTEKKAPGTADAISGAADWEAYLEERKNDYKKKVT